MERIDVSEKIKEIFPSLINALSNIYKNFITLDNYDSKQNLQLLFSNIMKEPYFEERLKSKNTTDTTKIFNLTDLPTIDFNDSNPTEYIFSQQDSKKDILEKHPMALTFLEFGEDPDEVYRTIYQGLPPNPPSKEKMQGFLALTIDIDGININFRKYPFGSTGVLNDEETQKVNGNNLGFSWSVERDMYIGGIKANDNYYYIKGNEQIKLLKELCIACKLNKLFIDDAAQVYCNFGRDTIYPPKSGESVIEIENFSIARILNGKDGFYEGALSGHYNEPEKAEKAKQFLRDVFFKTLSPEEQQILRDFIKCAKEPCPQLPSSNCNILKSIINKAKTNLIENGFVNKLGGNVLFDYIAVFDQKGGRKTKTNRKSKTSKKTKKHKKTRTTKMTKKRKKTKKR